MEYSRSTWDGLWESTERVRKGAVKAFQKALKDEELTECQEAALIKALATYDADKGASFETYLARIIQHECIDLIRLHKRSADRQIIKLVGSVWHSKAEEDASYRRWKAESNPLTEFVWWLLEHLSEADRQLILDRHCEGMPLEKLAKRHGLQNRMAASRKVNEINERLRRLGEEELAEYRQTDRAKRC